MTYNNRQLPLPDFLVPTTNGLHEPVKIIWVTSKSKGNDQITACLHEVGFDIDDLERFVCVVYANRGWRDDNATHDYFETCCSPHTYKMARVSKVKDLGLVTEQEFFNENPRNHLPGHFYADIYLMPL